ncbi:DUF1996 domain-containing protein, partial [Streptomyces sp. NPDC051219]|uniref:DUF1996 domain-containing protein n=1 Tax=Streptomyces sp. NPDC051219 TaxID=3155283 RepID=UPI0034297771
MSRPSAGRALQGNRTANASSTLTSLSTGTTNCTPRTDLSSYWTPTLYQNGVPVAPERVTVYYQGITDHTHAVAHPRGLQYVVGNALATSPDDNPAARWSCVGRPESGRDFITCPAGTKLENYLDFPTCWDGVRPDSPNHRDHMTYAAGQTCLASHPVPVPRLELLITWPVNGGGLRGSYVVVWVGRASRKVQRSRDTGYGFQRVAV